MPVRFKVGDPEGEGQAYLSTLESGPRENSVLNDKAGQYQHYLDLSFSTREFIPSTRKNLPRSVLSNPTLQRTKGGPPAHQQPHCSTISENWGHRKLCKDVTFTNFHSQNNWGTFRLSPVSSRFLVKGTTPEIHH